MPARAVRQLLSYHVSSQSVVQLPLYVKPMIQFAEGAGGRLDISVGPKNTMGKTIEDVVLTIAWPKSVLSVSATASVGSSTFDPQQKITRWDVGKIPLQRPPNLKGTIVLQAGVALPDSTPTISVDFKIPHLATSGIRVNRLDVYGEKVRHHAPRHRLRSGGHRSVPRRAQYKPFKGVKYITKAGKFQIRT